MNVLITEPLSRSNDNKKQYTYLNFHSNGSLQNFINKQLKCISLKVELVKTAKPKFYLVTT